MVSILGFFASVHLIQYMSVMGLGLKVHYTTCKLFVQGSRESSILINVLYTCSVMFSLGCMQAGVSIVRHILVPVAKALFITKAELTEHTDQ